MSSQQTLSSIKTVIQSVMPGVKVFLFGSRARGTQRVDSDFDILIITKNNIPLNEKRAWRTKVHKALVSAIHAPFDILLNSEEEIAVKKELPGHTINYAMKEAVLI